MSSAPRVGAAGETAAGDGEGLTDVASEVTHALRNHFHRLYYWLDLLAEQRLAEDGRSVLDAAATTTRAIERLATSALALSRPIELSPIVMDADEVIAGIAHSLRRLGATVHVTAAPMAGRRVAIDASHFARLLEVVGERLGASAERAMAITIGAEVDDDARVAVTLDASAPRRDGAPDEVERLVVWVHAERVMQQHGGALVWEEACGDARRAVLVLPAIE